MSDQSVLHEYMEWIVSFLEKRHEETGGLPVCPFAKAGLARGKATLAVGKLTRSFVMAQVRRLKATKADTMTIIDPRKTGMSWQEARRLCEMVNRAMFPKVLAISLHPEDPFNIAGLHTRRAPYPSIQLTEEKGGDAAFENLKTTDYYGHWTEQNDKDCYLGIESEALDLTELALSPTTCSESTRKGERPQGNELPVRKTMSRHAENALPGTAIRGSNYDLAPLAGETPNCTALDA